jgi:hypothetical protein
LSGGDQGKPNFAAPKLLVNKYPQTIRGIESIKSCHQKGNFVGIVSFLNRFILDKFRF